MRLTVAHVVVGAVLLGCGSASGLGDGPEDASLPVARTDDASADCSVTERGASDGGTEASGDAGLGHDAAPTCGALGATCCPDAGCEGEMLCSAGVCYCGANGDCPPGADCGPDGRCLQTLATNQDHPSALTVDDANVYWVDTATGGGDGLVLMAPRAGEPFDHRDRPGAPRCAPSDGTDVYWATNGALLRAPRSGGAATTLGTVTPSGSEQGRSGSLRVPPASTGPAWQAYERCRKLVVR